MSNNVNDQTFTAILLIGLFLAIIGMIFTFLLDMMEPVSFIITIGMIVLGFSFLVVCIDWIKQFLLQKRITNNLISFAGAILACFGFSFLIIYNIADPPELLVNDLGYGWFTTSEGFVWVFIPVIIVLFGFFLYQIGSGSQVVQKTEDFDGIRCPICTSFLKQKEEVSQCMHCGMVAHKTHFLEWVKTKGTCPQCRNPLLPEQIL